MEGRILHNNVIVDAIGNGAAEILEKVEHIQIVALWYLHIMQG